MTKVTSQKKFKLSAGREQQLAEWKQREAADEAVIRDWGQKRGF